MPKSPRLSTIRSWSKGAGGFSNTENESEVEDEGGEVGRKRSRPAGGGKSLKTRHSAKGASPPAATANPDAGSGSKPPKRPPGAAAKGVGADSETQSKQGKSKKGEKVKKASRKPSSRGSMPEGGGDISQDADPSSPLSLSGDGNAPTSESSASATDPLESKSTHVRNVVEAISDGATEAKNAKRKSKAERRKARAERKAKELTRAAGADAGDASEESEVSNGEKAGVEEAAAGKNTQKKSGNDKKRGVGVEKTGAEDGGGANRVRKGDEPAKRAGKRGDDAGESGEKKRKDKSGTGGARSETGRDTGKDSDKGKGKGTREKGGQNMSEGSGAARGEGSRSKSGKRRDKEADQRGANKEQEAAKLDVKEGGKKGKSQSGAKKADKAVTGKGKKESGSNASGSSRRDGGEGGGGREARRKSTGEKRGEGSSAEEEEEEGGGETPKGSGSGKGDKGKAVPLASALSKNEGGESSRKNARKAKEAGRSRETTGRAKDAAQSNKSSGSKETAKKGSSSGSSKDAAKGEGATPRTDSAGKGPQRVGQKGKGRAERQKEKDEPPTSLPSPRARKKGKQKEAPSVSSSDGGGDGKGREARKKLTLESEADDDDPSLFFGLPVGEKSWVEVEWEVEVQKSGRKPEEVRERGGGYSRRHRVTLTGMIIPCCRYACASRQYQQFGGNRHWNSHTAALINSVCAMRLDRHYIVGSRHNRGAIAVSQKASDKHPSPALCPDRTPT